MNLFLIKFEEKQTDYFLTSNLTNLKFLFNDVITPYSISINLTKLNNVKDKKIKCFVSKNLEDMILDLEMELNNCIYNKQQILIIDFTNAKTRLPDFSVLKSKNFFIRVEFYGETNLNFIEKNLFIEENELEFYSVRTNNVEVTKENSIIIKRSNIFFVKIIVLI